MNWLTKLAETSIQMSSLPAEKKADLTDILPAVAGTSTAIPAAVAMAAYHDPSRLRNLGAALSTLAGSGGGALLGGGLGALLGSLTGYADPKSEDIFPFMFGGALPGSLLGSLAAYKLYSHLLPPRWKDEAEQYKENPEEELDKLKNEEKVPSSAGSKLLNVMFPLESYKDPSFWRRFGVYPAGLLGSMAGSYLGSELGGNLSGDVVGRILGSLLGSSAGALSTAGLYRLLVPPRWENRRRKFYQKDE